APVEPDEVEPGQEHGQGVDEPAAGVPGEVAGEQRAVGQGEFEVGGDQRAAELLTGGGSAAADKGPRLDEGDVEVAERAEDVELAQRLPVIGLLDGEDLVADLDTAHDVAGDAAGQTAEQRFRPLVERQVPGQFGQCT